MAHAPATPPPNPEAWSPTPTPHYPAPPGPPILPAPPSIVAGQRRLKLTPEQTSEMITIAKQDPVPKARSCEEQARKVEAVLAR